MTRHQSKKADQFAESANPTQGAELRDWARSLGVAPEKLDQTGQTTHPGYAVQSGWRALEQSQLSAVPEQSLRTRLAMLATNLLRRKLDR